MQLSQKTKLWAALTALVGLLYIGYGLIVWLNQRSFLYFPSSSAADTSLTAWMVNDQIIGYCRTVAQPRTVWLMTHGNGGQASGRAYALKRMSATDSLYVLEYPGYGLRAGSPSEESINQAALAAYQALRKEFPKTPVCVLGESLGSGPAAYLASTPTPPDKIVLVVPFDTMASVASDHMPLLPVSVMLQDNWNNIDALKSYSGPLEIYGAINDRIIGFEHARNLAAHIKNAKFVAIECGHNDWANSDLVRIER
jgi:uncharacterized protein